MLCKVLSLQWGRESCPGRLYSQSSEALHVCPSELVILSQIFFHSVLRQKSKMTASVMILLVISKRTWMKDLTQKRNYCKNLEHSQQASQVACKWAKAKALEARGRNHRKVERKKQASRCCDETNELQQAILYLYSLVSNWLRLGHMPEPAIASQRKAQMEGTSINPFDFRDGRSGP